MMLIQPKPFIPSDPVGQETLESFANALAFNRWMFEAIAPYCSGRVLEIGSGIGNISKLLLRQTRRQPAGSSRVTLSDFRPEYCQILLRELGGQPGLEDIVLIDLSTTDFEKIYAPLLHRFDTIVALNVIEHIENDRLAVDNCKMLLKPEGVLVILVPAFSGLYNNLDRELGHFRRYTKKSLTRLLMGSRLRVNSTRYFDVAGIPAWWYSGSIRGKKIIGPGQVSLYNKLVPVFRLLDRLVAAKIGLSVIITASNLSNTISC
jgi:2-polyprenyl-3-methyl-5-hydroxy-6-metoxy-1,4-benzoquinol methylase